MRDQVLLLAPSNQETLAADLVRAFQRELEDRRADALSVFQPPELGFYGMLDSDLVLYMKDRHWRLTYGNGYTGTTVYLRKQAETLVERYQHKYSPDAYLLEYYVLNLIGTVYPLLTKGDRLIPWLTWASFTGTESTRLRLDTGLFLDAAAPDILRYGYKRLDTGEFVLDDPGIVPQLDELVPVLGTKVAEAWSLDAGNIAGSMTRHFLLSYEHQFAESETVLASDDTARALYDDVFQLKRSVEVPHFEETLLIAGEADTEVETSLPSEERETDTTTPLFLCPQRVIYLGSDLQYVWAIQFGYGNFPSPLSLAEGYEIQNLFRDTGDAVKVPVGPPVPIDGDVIQVEYQTLADVTKLYLRTVIRHDAKIFDAVWGYKGDQLEPFQQETWFAEVALIEKKRDDQRVVCYAALPVVQFDPRMLSSVFLKFEVSP